MKIIQFYDSEYDLISNNLNFNIKNHSNSKYGKIACELDDAEIEKLLEVLSSALLDRGFKANDEPNGFGFKIEGLIDRIYDQLSE